MIALRDCLAARRSRPRSVFVLVLVLGAFVGAHGPGEAHPMPGDDSGHGDDIVLAICLGVLAGGLAASLAMALRSGWRRAHLTVSAWRPRVVSELASPEAPQRPPPWSRAASLQVFLR